MNENYNFEKEKNIIYTAEYLERNNELFTLAIYHRFCLDFVYSLDCKEYSKIYLILLRKKLKECIINKDSKEEKYNYKEFIIEYFNTLINNKDVIDEPSLIGAIDFINNYKIYIDEIIDNLDWVNIVNKKNLSFNDKSNIVLFVNNTFDNIDLTLTSLGGYEETEKIREELKNKIITFIKEYDDDIFSFELLEQQSKNLIKDILKEKIDNNEINFNNTMDLNIKNFIVSSNGLTKKILYYFLPYALAGIEDIELDDEKLISNIASELKVTKFRAKIELYKFLNNWLKICRSDCKSFYASKVLKKR